MKSEKTPCLLVKSASVLRIPELKSKSQSVTVLAPQL